MPFRVSFAGQDWRTDDLTLDEAIRIEAATGKSWMLINPFHSATDCKAIIVAFLARGTDEATAQAKVGSLSLREVLESVDVVKDDLPDLYQDGLPKAEDGDSTTGLSGEPDGSGGPPT